MEAIQNIFNHFHKRPFPLLCYKYNSLFRGLWLFFIIFLWIPQISQAQTPDSLVVSIDSLAQNVNNTKVDSLDVGVDSLAQKTDSLQVDTLRYKISPDSLDAPVYFDARDSIEYDLINKKILLYGQAKVKYTTISLEAGFIELNWETNILTADFVLDSLGKPIEKPKFADGDQNFTANKLRYNFKTKKGQIIDARTVESNLYVLSEKAKFFAEAGEEKQDYVFSKNAIFTTCDAEHPHYGIKSRKQKVVPNKLIVVGPSNLEIMDVPTPLFLPFGFFPIFEKRHAGLIFPQDYEYSPELGYGLRNVGYYLPLGPNYDLKLTGDIYMKGSWGAQAAMKYKKRYKYSGELTLAMHTIITEQQGVLGKQITRPTKIMWTHSQDRMAHPYNSFSGRVNIETSKFERTTQNRANNQLNAMYSSSVTFRRKFPSSPFSMTLGASHSQVVQTGKVTMDLPTLNVNMKQIYPFKRKNRIGKELWYEKFSLTYSGQAKNSILTSDTTLFNKETWQDLKIGAQHKLATSASYRMLKFFNFTPSIHYQERWYMKGEQYSFDNNLDIIYDTLMNPDGSILNILADTVGYGGLDTTRFTGFRSIRTFDASANLSTKLFGTLRFRRGFLRGIRHTISPTVGFRYQPDYVGDPFNYYQVVQTDSRQAPDEYPKLYGYSRMYGQPPNSGKQMALTYGLGNLFEAKYFSRKDSTAKIMRLFDNINVSGTYNFAADSMRFSKVSMSGGSKLFKNISNVRMSATFDPYAQNEQGRTINEFYWNTNHKVLRFVKFNMNFSTGFTLKQMRDILQGKNQTTNKSTPNKKSSAKASNQFFDWFESFRINHSFTVDFLPIDGKIERVIQLNTINVNGAIPLTRLWKVNIRNMGYDFKGKAITYPDFGLSRDLHCWNMGINWQPVHGTYSFFLKVTSNPLDFLKLPYQRNYYDAQKVAF